MWSTADMKVWIRAALNNMLISHVSNFIYFVDMSHLELLIFCYKKIQKYICIFESIIMYCQHNAFAHTD